MEKIYTLTESQLEEIIAQRMSHKPITPQGLFKKVSFKGDELLEINQKYPDVVEKLRNDWNVRSVDPAKFIYTNAPQYNEVINETSYHTLGFAQVHNAVRMLVLHVFGKSQNKELTAEEYEMAQALYTELKDWYIRSYDKRLETLES